jgi:arsenite-transporting ATPase
MSQVIFFGGKGGVGKTSCSAAFSLAKSETSKVLIVSTDPAHSTSDVFGIKIGGSITRIKDNLDGIEIDAEKESQTYINGIKNNLSQIISPIILDEIRKQLDAASVSPGSHESALFDKMMEIIIKGHDVYDYIIFDTAPTGHTIRLLSLPELLGSWMETLLKKRKKTMSLKRMTQRIKGEKEVDDPVLEILERRRQNLISARKILMDDNNLEFIFVLNPEKLPLEETKKAVKLLEKYKIPVKKMVINRILPDNPTEGFWIKKKEQESKYLNQIEKDFEGKYLFKIPLFDEDMHKSSLSSMSSYFH